MWILSLKKENFSGFCHRKLRVNLSDERFRQRVRRFAFPLLKPVPDASAEIAGALGEKVLRQLRRAALQVGLADFNNGKQPLTFALPFRFSIFAPQSSAEETQVMCPTKQIR